MGEEITLLKADFNGIYNQEQLHLQGDAFDVFAQ